MMIDHGIRFADHQWLKIQIHRASKLVAADTDDVDDHMNDF